MSLDPACVGLETAPHELDYDWRTCALYALGIGAKRDELDYLYEGRGPKVYPTLGVVPAYGPVSELLGKTGGNLSTMVHAAQTVTRHAPIPPEGTFRTIGRILAVHDLKRLAQVVCETVTEVGGVHVCTTEWTLLFRGDGGFGGRPPPKASVPKPADGQEPSWSFEETTSPEQALLYRLSGDTNPLHADPEMAASVGFQQGPILHGLATFGFIARAIVRRACGGDGDRLRSLTAQFRKPVWPGESLRCDGYEVGGRVVVKAFAGGRPDAVVTGCFAEVAR